MWAYCDGEYVPYEEARVHTESLAMRYALVAFEGVRGYRQADHDRVTFFALGEHLARLRDTLATIGMDAPPVADLRTAALALLERNEIRSDCYLRIAAPATSDGDLNSPAKARFYVSVRPMERKPWLAEGRSMNVSISRWQKPDDAVFPQRAKVISNYAGPRLALLEAKRNGFDSTVLTTVRRHLAEAPTANLFVFLDGVLCTPPLEDAILDGITRRWILRLARHRGIPARELSLTANDAHRADEAFLCGTGLELARIGALDGHVMESSRVFEAIVADYFRLVRSPTEFRLEESAAVK